MQAFQTPISLKIESKQSKKKSHWYMKKEQSLCEKSELGY